MTTFSPPGAPRLTLTNVTMTLLICYAFDINASQISAKPGWFDSTYYDVSAKPEGDVALSYEQLKPLMQQLLQQRFHLAIHHETKEVSGYALVVAKGGPKLHAGKESSAMAYILKDGLRSASMPMKSFAAMLAHPLQQPVIDKTNLTGNYELVLNYAPEGSTDSTYPSIFAAVEEQLGLKLQPQKVPVDFIAIDHMDKIPTEN